MSAAWAAAREGDFRFMGLWLRLARPLDELGGKGETLLVATINVGQHVMLAFLLQALPSYHPLAMLAFLLEALPSYHPLYRPAPARARLNLRDVAFLDITRVLTNGRSERVRARRTPAVTRRSTTRVARARCARSRCCCAITRRSTRARTPTASRRCTAR